MIYPEIIDSFESQGEKIFHYKLRTDPKFKNCLILHSLFLSKHVKNISGEIDFLVLFPNKGIFALELKHGNVSREQGVWYYKNKKGKVTESTKGPFRQVSDAMHSLRNWILLNCSESKKDKISKFLFGNGVIFSGIEEPIELGTEAFGWQVLYRDSIVSNGTFDFMCNLSRGWHNELRGKYFYDNELSKPSADDCRYIVKLLRGDFSKAYSLLNKTKDNRKVIENLTEEQVSQYEHISFNPRNLVQGIAGTGKTVLAYKLAIEKISEKKRIMFVCFNNNLGDKISIDFCNYSTDSFFGSFHSFLTKRTQGKNSEKDGKYYTHELPIDFLIQNEGFLKFDYLIIDEAQDLISEEYLMVFDHVLKGGLIGGRWSFFGDFENQNIYGEKNNLVLLEPYPFSRYKPLDVNCRNTIEIMNKNSVLTSVKYKNCLNINAAEKVFIRFPIHSKQIRVLSHEMNKLIEEGASLSQISILCPSNSEVERIKSSSLMKDLTDRDKINLTTIQSFKGLENDFVFLIGFSELTSDYSQQLLYIGISRACYKLFLIFDKSIEQEYINLLTQKLKL